MHSVLLVEDDADIRLAIQELLLMQGYSIHTAVNGLDALAILDKIPRPSVILLDWNMPKMNGGEFLDRKEKEKDIATIPVVILTASIQRSKVQSTYNEFLSKPMDILTLSAVVKKYCA